MVNEVALANCGGATKALWCQTGAHGLMKLKDKWRVPRDTQGWMWSFPEEAVAHTLDLGLTSHGVSLSPQSDDLAWQ
jgi:hypothetical protein